MSQLTESGQREKTARPSGSGRKTRPVLMVLFTVGAVLMPAGIGSVYYGWYGAAHTRYEYDQFPYLMSGGLLGVVLAVIGGFLYFSALSVKQAQEQRDAMRRLAESVSELAAAVASGQAGSSAGARLVVAGEHGETIHRGDCTLIAKRDDLRAVTGVEPGLTPCRVCAPVI
jgi:hypothetical protein